MGPARFQETGPSVLDARTVALLQVAVSVAIGSSAVCLQWITARALVSRKWSGDLRQSQLTIR